MRRRVELQPGYVLHSYPYRETSLVVETFVKAFGRVAMLAKGARRPRSALRGTLLAFHPLRLSWSSGGELAVLTGTEWIGGLTPLAGLNLMCGFYLNELLLKLMPRDDPHEALFDCYEDCLMRLSEGQARNDVLRRFERRLLAELGYAPTLDREADTGGAVDPAQRYVYDPERGPLRASHVADPALPNVSGQTLLDLARDEYGRIETREESRRLMRALIAKRLGTQTLHTRTVLMELQDL